MNQSHQNLARSWRPKQFQEVVGQPLPVRMLQNSLYTNHFFPVYLFAGQRGCGKTTTARIFSAALNCAKLADFQKNPKQQVPCDVCPSCQMMQQGKHPDFIEIDAASHTGVDNVRAIVDAASFMPLVGGKRVYLIDEAHMLSKAAFNAFLKILEEPPASVLFILATTDPHKIIDTVRSRCFQLFFDAVAMDAIVAHLKNVCTQEEISHDDAGLMAIVANSEGSVRDALNVLEQVRFSAPSVTKKAVLAILGHVDEEHINNLFCALLKADAHQLQKILGEINFSLIAPEPLWYSICLLARSAMWQALGVQDVKISEAVERLLAEVTSSRIKLVFEMVCSYEMPLKKTTKKHLLLEMLFLRLCSDTFSHDASPSSGQKESIGIRSTTEKKSSAAVNQSVSPVHERSGSRKPLHDGAQELQEKSAPVVEEIVVRSQVPSDMVDTWKNFLIA
ncbi:MAG: DNA polymerase III subunit gamma/tau, partial [Candidatus Babeliales bacterium]